MTATLSPTRLLVRLSQAGAKRARSVLRHVNGREHPQWQTRAEICQRCPLLVVQCRKTYCGRPFLQQIERNEPTEGCGCPVLAKAKDPAEHCPRERHYNASTKFDARTCDCMWCVGLRANAGK